MIIKLKKNQRLGPKGAIKPVKEKKNILSTRVQGVVTLVLELCLAEIRLALSDKLQLYIPTSLTLKSSAYSTKDI
jgi:hypothetical protein